MNSSNSRKMKKCRKKKCRKKKCEKVWDEFKSALDNEEPLDVIDTIIEQNLLVLEQSFEPYGRTPLIHLCCSKYRVSGGSAGYRFDVIERLIERCPKALTLADNDGYLPLHHICEVCHPVRFDVIERLVERFPKALTIADKSGCLPLHIICYCSSVPLHLVQLFVSKFPDSVKAKDKDNRTPLHCALETRDEDELSLDVIQFLYQQYPEAVLDQDDNGWTPLHLACDDRHGPEVLQIVYHPTAARMQSRNDFIPIHFVNDDTPMASQFLLERDPVLLLELHLRNNHRGNIDDENECYQIAALSLLRELVNKHKQSPKKMKQNVMAVYLGRLLETRPYPTLKQLDSLAPSITLKVSPDQIYRELKDMLYKRTFRELLKVHRNMIRINQSGYLREDPGNKAKCVAVLASTAGGANKISNVHLLFQQLRENTLLCNRLPSPLLFSNKKEQQEQQKPRRSKRLKKENQQEEEQQIMKRSKR